MRLAIAEHRGANRNAVFVNINTGFVVIIMKTQLGCLAQGHKVLLVKIEDEDILISIFENCV